MLSGLASVPAIASQITAIKCGCRKMIFFTFGSLFPFSCISAFPLPLSARSSSPPAGVLKARMGKYDCCLLLKAKKPGKKNQGESIMSAIFSIKIFMWINFFN